MELHHFDRRTFIKGSVSTVALTSLPGGIAHAQTVRPRLEWQDFRRTASYAQFVNAVRTMRANTNANDRGSWNFWVNAHANNCPHSIPYFLAWHRGFIFYFEQQLRIISGNSTLMLPYWDYYRFPRIPTEFTTPSTNNPLFVNRVNTNVFSALSLAPFSLTNFQRGTPNAFETSLEPRPHGQVHNIIGGSMASLNSPADPIFWLHHGQIDRLLHAWVLSGGKRYPPSGDAYWAGTFTYAGNLTIARNRVYNPANLGYTYSDTTLPRSLPAQAESGGGLMRASMQGKRSPLAMRVAMDDGPPGRPPAARFPFSEPRPTGEKRRSIGGARNIPLGESGISAQVPVAEADSQVLQSMMGSTQASPFGRTSVDSQGYTSAQVVLDNVQVTQGGEFGGYFYDVYLNLPQNRDPSSTQERYLVGSFGPFEVSSARHHGRSARLVFPATQLLQNFTESQIKQLTVSFVRVNGDAAPKGVAVTIGEMRIELSTDNVE
ncbi:MAG: tyrosinase [Burkholderiales bacterium]